MEHRHEGRVVTPAGNVVTPIILTKPTSRIFEKLRRFVLEGIPISAAEIIEELLCRAEKPRSAKNGGVAGEGPHGSGIVRPTGTRVGGEREVEAAARGRHHRVRREEGMLVVVELGVVSEAELVTSALLRDVQGAQSFLH